jgi:hypothetical protein
MQYLGRDIDKNTEIEYHCIDLALAFFSAPSKNKNIRNKHLKKCIEYKINKYRPKGMVRDYLDFLKRQNSPFQLIAEVIRISYEQPQTVAEFFDRIKFDNQIVENFKECKMTKDQPNNKSLMKNPLLWENSHPIPVVAPLFNINEGNLITDINNHGCGIVFLQEPVQKRTIILSNIGEFISVPNDTQYVDSKMGVDIRYDILTEENSISRGALIHAENLKIGMKFAFEKAPDLYFVVIQYYTIGNGVNYIVECLNNPVEGETTTKLVNRILNGQTFANAELRVLNNLEFNLVVENRA